MEGNETDDSRITQLNGNEPDKIAAIVQLECEAIIEHSLDGTIVSWNSGAEKLYGYPASEAIGSPISILLPAGTDDDLPTLLHNVKLGKSIENYAAARVRKDGKYVEVTLSMSPLFDRNGKITGASTIARDLTQHNRANEVLRALSSMEATTLLAGGVAHDLNNLMAAVLGNAELLALEFRGNGNAQDSIDVILTSAQMAGRLAQELLAFAQGGRHESAVLNLNNTVQEVLAVQRSVKPEGISLRTCFAHDLKNVEADSAQMGQLFHNLTMNAIEAIEGDGEIVIATGNKVLDEVFAKTYFGMKPGPHVVVSVTDTGCGMTEEVLGNIFKPFFSTKGQGRGLGLAAVYGIATNHGGCVTAESKSGNGTCITVYLPVTTLQPVNQPEANIERSKGNETILVVDDEAQLVMLNRRILEANGYKVLTARDGEEAVRVASEFEGDIHLVVLDMAMPVMGGAKAFTLLKQVRPACKIIISSGYDLNDQVRSLLTSGADAFLQKPFRLTELTSEVRRLLDSAGKA